MQITIRVRTAHVFVLVLAIVLSAVAVRAAIPDPNGLIHGCYQRNNGQLRVIDTGQACTSGEVGITWSQTGPQGPQGPPGPQGPQGAQGPQGVPGPAGVFSGTFTSPNGQYSLAVTDSGITLSGSTPAQHSVTLDSSGITLASAVGSLSLQGGGIAAMVPGSIALQGGLITLNGGAPAARVSDLVQVQTPTLGVISSGSSTVFIGN